MADRSRSRSRSRGKTAGTGGRVKGSVARWNERGFGFVSPEGGGDDVFCHLSQITDGNCLKEGDPVEFEIMWDDRRGKDRVENLTGGIDEERKGAPPGAGDCYAWRDGECNRGDACRFSHSGPGGPPGGRGGGGGPRGGYDDRRDDRGYDRRDDRGYDRRDDRGGGGYDRGYDRRDEYRRDEYERPRDDYRRDERPRDDYRGRY